MKFTNLLTDDAILVEVGHRLMAARLDRNQTQAQLADAAGVSKSTVERLEAGQSVQLANLIRCLRALGTLEGLDRLLPEAGVNPMDQLRKHRVGRPRRRASGKARQAAAGVQEGAAPAPGWVWGDRK